VPIANLHQGFAATDNRVIAAGLETMKHLVVGRGGFVHPEAQIAERGGALRVICRAPIAEGQLLFKVPDDLLVPLEELAWSESEVTFQLAQRPGSLSADRLEMLDLFIAIYNGAGKPRWARDQANILLSRDAELAAQVDLVMPDSAIKAPTLAAAFLNTRYYSSQYALAGLAGRNCLMPLIDFINHNPAGANFRQSAGHLQIDISHATESSECYANYGLRSDPLALALGHGYLDPDAPVARSVPADIHFTGFGRFQVTGRGIMSSHPADPPKVEFHEDGLTLSHFAGDLRKPAYLMASLRLAMLASGKRRGISDAVIERALAELPAAIHASGAGQPISAGKP
jgi:hypothetical protein